MSLGRLPCLHTTFLMVREYAGICQFYKFTISPHPITCHNRHSTYIADTVVWCGSVYKHYIAKHIVYTIHTEN